jgi:hypothetical protein
VEYVHNHIKHYNRKCPRIVSISDALIAQHREDVVYETCQRCEKERDAGALKM